MGEREMTRRQLLGKGGVLAVGLMAPPWLSAVARADVLKLSKGQSLNPDHVLVVCQLSGGNDGLNTVVPFKDSAYYKARPVLGVPESQVLKLNDSVGLHPRMTALHDLYKQGKVAVVQNVGYPNPNRSHFKSMDIWQSASPDGKLKHGWVGRAFDLAGSNSKLDAITGLGLSTERPLALSAAQSTIPCFASLNDIESLVGDADMEKMLRDIQGMDAQSGTATRTVQDANRAALDAMATLKKQLGGFQPVQKYNDDRFGQGFKQIAQLIATSPQTRVVYFSNGGFDTHSKQAETHAELLGNFSDAVKSFMDELQAVGKADKVLVLVFSEFGRRSYENGSAGTDHGAAGPMFLIGNRVKGGVHGPNPDFTNLQQGDIGMSFDFRQVYATALDDWMDSDSKVVLGDTYQKLAVLQ